MRSLIFALNAKDARELISVSSLLNIRSEDTYVLLPKESFEQEKNIGKVKVVTIDASIPEIVVYSKAVAESIWEFSRENNIDLMIFIANRFGKEIAAYLAQLAKVDLISEATKLYWTENRRWLVGERYFLAGKAIVKEVLKKKPYIATITPGVYSNAKTEDKGIPIASLILEVKYKDKVKIDNIKAKKTEGVNIENARIIVSVGRGFKKKEDLKLAFELAELLGAEIGCSRPIAADLKWLSEDHWVGLSGHKVRPELYIAIGISGQSQHIAGMKDSKLVVAINIDKEAPIFSNADYGIVGDLYKVLPLLINELKKRYKKK